MARIVLGLGTSHTPQLSSPVESWPQHGENDKKNPWLFDRAGKRVTYDEVLAAADPNIPARELTSEKQHERHAAAQKAVAHLQDALTEAAPDVM
ncbi:MAG: protocatechuate 3,4-dioxygenase, partial [Chloroflexota bacterium]